MGSRAEAVAAIGWAGKATNARLKRGVYAAASSKAMVAQLQGVVASLEEPTSEMAGIIYFVTPLYLCAQILSCPLPRSLLKDFLDVMGSMSTERRASAAHLGVLIASVAALGMLNSFCSRMRESVREVG